MRLPRRPLLIAALAVGSLGPSAAAPAAPVVLPGGKGTQPQRWIVGARPSAAAQTLASRRRARAIPSLGAFVVAREQAHGLARSFERRGLLRWAEPDRRLRARAISAGTTGVPWRTRLGLEALTLPPGGPDAPFLALLDTPVDLAHPAFAAGNVALTRVAPSYDFHGTATAAIAGATGVMSGVWPGLRVIGYPFPADNLTCWQSALAIERASAAGAAAINMSYGSDEPCFTERAAVQLAVRRGVVLVAAAGNERREGDPLEFPASFPHVISVAALEAGDAPAAFSSSGRAVDVAAPGQDVLTAVPVGFDPDGTPDGFASLTGTSFAAPMVAAAAVWLRTARPTLSADQIATLLCDSARDLAERGWDSRTGCGALNLAAALQGRVPRRDHLEPNDDIMWVDGRVLRPAAPLVWRGGRRVTVTASVTSGEDIVDVYRVRLPVGRRARVSFAAPRGVVLRVLDHSALDVSDRSALLAKRRSPGGVTIAHRAGAARTAFVAVLHDHARARARTTPYRLSIRRP